MSGRPGGEGLPEGVEGVGNPSMHRGASCAKMVENYQDARGPRSAQGVMPLKVIAALMPFGIASRIAVFSVWIFPSTPIDPEQSAIQMKCRGRVASSPPGRFAMTGLPRMTHIEEIVFSISSLTVGG